MNQRGFTLVELMVVAVLTVVVAGGLLTAFMTGQTSYFSADAYIQVQQEARRAFDVMVRELREAGPSDDPDPNNELNVNAGQLNFKVAMGFNVNDGAGGCPDTGICWGDGTTPGQWIHYGLRTNTTLTANNQGQLVRCTSGTRNDPVGDQATGLPGCRVLANNVTVAIFTPDAAKEVVAINLAVSYVSRLVPGGSQGIGTGGGATPLVARVRLRNAP